MRIKICYCYRSCYYLFRDGYKVADFVVFVNDPVALCVYDSPEPAGIVVKVIGEIPK